MNEKWCEITASNVRVHTNHLGWGGGMVERGEGDNKRTN